MLVETTMVSEPLTAEVTEADRERARAEALRIAQAHTPGLARMYRQVEERVVEAIAILVAQIRAETTAALRAENQRLRAVLEEVRDHAERHSWTMETIVARCDAVLKEGK